ncbi:tryptophan synthase beta chain [Helicobacter bizzozeronii CIII-1]|uniref:tryptophan synthase n=2 Tax=Helicobacter bizzozeronii TaxID=56877 RepID=F8KUC9_HELBC|nr:tryptophan synthase beta chain [Helicobacter bizzozeronii CIII-1]
MSKPSLFLKSQNMFFGEHFGGMFVPENLKSALLELAKAYENILPTPPFQNTFKDLCTHFIGRPTPLIFAKNASAILGNEIYLKFEGLANTGAHKINNALGQVLLAKMMGKTKVIAETGAGQHGLATASA